MQIIYDFIFFLVGFFYLPYYFFKKKSLKGLSSRIKTDFYLDPYKPRIWLHAASVGEVMAARLLLRILQERYAGKEVVITTITPTGQKIAQEIVGKEKTSFLPLDLSFFVRDFVEKINPCLFILLETEIWPNLIFSLKKKNVPIVLVNGRLSHSSFRGYSLVKRFLAPLLNKIDLFLVQTPNDRQRFIKLGTNPDRIKITGNMKFDILNAVNFKKDIDDLLLRKMGIDYSEKLLVAASTHSPEEKFILHIYKKLKFLFPFLRLLIAPRHPQRSFKVSAWVRSYGFKARLISDIDNGGSDKNEIFILDSIGKLLDFYAIADIVFVGGSLVKKGGHNILEPALFKKPIIFGPYMFNFQDVSDLFLREQAAIMVHNAHQLYKALQDLLSQPSRGMVLGEHAYQLIQKNQGVTLQNLKWIESIFSGI